MLNNDTKFFAGIIVIIVLILIGWIFISKMGQSNQAQSLPQFQNEFQSQPTTTEASVKEFTVAGTPFKMDPAEIKVKQGDRVKITFKNEEGFHNLTIKDFNVATKNIQKGEQETIEFTADKTGVFEYNCTVPTHTEKGMVGQLIVE